MRKLKRSVAHFKMQKEGIRKVNRKENKNGHKTSAGKSFFAEHWKEYI
jgi:hypothetical protein